MAIQAEASVFDAQLFPGVQIPDGQEYYAGRFNLVLPVGNGFLAKAEITNNQEGWGHVRLEVP